MLLGRFCLLLLVGVLFLLLLFFLICLNLSSVVENFDLFVGFEGREVNIGVVCVFESVIEVIVIVGVSFVLDGKVKFVEIFRFEF